MRRLRAAGWSRREAAAFLAARDPSRTVGDARRALAAALRQRRRSRGVTQVRLAALIGSSQSRVAKMEAADSAVSLELLVRALVVLGATRREVGRVVGSGRVPPRGRTRTGHRRS